MQIALTGRAALVTGASRGIGRAIAVALARAGATVCINYRQQHERAKETLAAIEAAGGHGFVYQADVSDRAQTEALIGAVPHPDGRGFLPDALPGEVPDPAHPPVACRFHPRCPYAFDRCKQEDPRLLRVAPGRTAACWLQREGGPPARPAEQAQRLPLLRTEE